MESQPGKATLGNKNRPRVKDGVARKGAGDREGDGGKTTKKWREGMGEKERGGN